ncbi:oligosaccharide flippase family protein [Candidatus Curtissbacteria bacterium]|nr:oligosaccharide flippase family protein [Candidatus Curtissbacteria bacterium]
MKIFKKDYVQALFTKPGSRNTLIVLGGTIINSLIGGLFFVLAPRFIGPEKYGLFAVVSSTGVLIASVANLGIDSGILNFASKNDSVANRVLKLALESYIVIGLITFLAGFVLAKPLAQFLGTASLAPLIQVAFSLVIVFLLTDFFVAVLQAREQFAKAFMTSISSNTIRLIILLFGAYFFIIDLPFLTYLFFLVPIVSVIVGKIFTPTNFLSAKDHRKEFRNFFGFNFWIAASFAVSAFPVDNYMLLKMAGPIATGLYAAPFKLLSIVDQLAGNYSRVLAPKISQLDSREKTMKFIQSTLPIALPVALIFFVMTFLGSPIVKLILGTSYEQSTLVFSLVSLASLFTFLTAIPVSITIYHFNAAKVAFVITLISMAIWIALNFLLIPTYQQYGAAVAYLLTEILILLFHSSYIFYKIRK